MLGWMCTRRRCAWLSLRAAGAARSVRLAASNAASAASIDWWRAPLRTKGGAVEALSLPGLVGSCPRGWCKSASLLASQPRIGRPPHLVTQCGVYPISRPIGRLFPHPAKGRRVFRGAEDLRLIRGHLFRRVAQGRNAGKIAATRGLATEVCQTSITFGHAWPISPGRRMAALDQTWQPQATSRNGCFRLEFRMPGWRERWTRSEGAAGYERQHATGSSRALIYSGGRRMRRIAP